MLRNKGGVPFHGEISGDGSVTPLTFILYDHNRTVLTVGTNDEVVITAYHVMTSSGTAVYFQSGESGDPGSNFRWGDLAANGGFAGSGVELVCKKGEKPTLSSTGAATLYGNIEGRIFRNR